MSESRTARGFAYGVVATIAMSVLVLVGTVTGVSPIPESIPKALVATVLGGTPEPVVTALAVVGHLAYGGAFGALLAWMARPVTFTKALGLGVTLWGFLQVVFLPMLGWGVFGSSVTPQIAVATLLAHLVYGGVLGWAMTPDHPGVDAHPASAAD